MEHFVQVCVLKSPRLKDSHGACMFCFISRHLQGMYFVVFLTSVKVNIAKVLPSRS